MTVIGWIQIILFCAIVVALVKPLGWYMTRVFNGERTFLSPVLRPVEAGIYWIGGVDEKREQHWLTYAVAMLLFHVGGFLILYALMRLQAWLPFNPAEQSAVAEGLSFNTAVSFVTNTNWQNYGGDCTDPRFCSQFGPHRRKFLGRYHALHPLHPHPDLRALRAVPDLAGHPANARRLCGCNNPRRREADHRARPGR